MRIYKFSYKDSISLILVLILSLVSLLCVLPLDPAGASASERRLQAEVNVLLAVQTDNEAGNIHYL